MTNFKDLAVTTAMAAALNAPASAARVKPGLTAPVVKSAKAEMQKAEPMAKANPNEVPRLFPQMKLPEFVPVTPAVNNSPSPKLVEAMLQASLITGYSPGIRLAFAEMETAGTYNPLAHASKSKKDENGRIVGVEKSGSAAGTSMFIEATFDRVINQNGAKILHEAGVPKDGKPLQGNSLFNDNHFSDQQIVEIVKAHTGRDANKSGDRKNLPIRRGSDELFALRANPLIDQLASDKLKDEAAVRTPGGMYENHLLGGNILSNAARSNGSKALSASVFGEESGVVTANKHMFFQGGEALAISQTLGIIEGAITGRAVMLERKFLGTTFTPNAADEKRDNTPREFTAADGKVAKVMPKLVVRHNSLAQYVEARERTRIEQDAFEVVSRQGDKPAADRLANKATQPQVEQSLRRLGFLDKNDTLDQGLARYRDAAGLPPTRLSGFIESSLLANLSNADKEVSRLASLQAQQARPASPEIKNRKTGVVTPAVPAAPGALDLRQMQKELGGLLTPAERKAAIRQQVIELKRDLISDGALPPAVEKVKQPYIDAKGKARTRMIDQPRGLDPKRDGNIDKSLIATVERAQAARGLVPTGVVDQTLKSPKPVIQSPYMKVPGAGPVKISAAPVAEPEQKISAVARQFQPDDSSPSAAPIQYSLTPPAGPTGMFGVVSSGHGAAPTSYAAVPALRGEIQTVDLSGIIRFVAEAPVAAPQAATRPAAKPPIPG